MGQVHTWKLNDLKSKNDMILPSQRIDTPTHKLKRQVIIDGKILDYKFFTETLPPQGAPAHTENHYLGEGHEIIIDGVDQTIQRTCYFFAEK